MEVYIRKVHTLHTNGFVIVDILSQMLTKDVVERFCKMGILLKIQL